MPQTFANLEQEYTALRARVATNENEIAWLRAILKEQAEYADGCMEGAGEPEFSQFSIIAASCRKALAANSEGLPARLFPRGCPG